MEERRSHQDAPAEAKRGYDLGSLLQNSALYAASDIGLKLIAFLLIPLYTRALTPDDYGIIGFTDALTQVLSPVIGLGIVSSVPMLYYRYRGEEYRRFISTVVNVLLLYGFVMTAALIAGGRSLLVPFAGDIPFVPYIVLSLLTLYAMSFYFLPLVIFNMEEKAPAHTLYSLGLSLLMVCTNILLVLVLRLGALGAIWARLIVGAVGMTVVILVIRRHYRPVIDVKMLWTLLALALPVLPHLFSSTLLRFADRFFLVNRASLAETGIYSVGMQVSAVVLVAMGGVTTALNPLFYRRANQSDPALPGDWARLCTLFLFGSLWLALGMALLGPDLIALLTPPRYHEAMALIPVLVVGQVLTGLYWLFSPGIGHTRKTWVYPVASIPTMALNLWLNTLLVPRYGAAGSAWAMVAAAGLQCLLFGFFSLRYYPVPLQYGELGKALAGAGAVMVLALIPFPGGPWSSFLWEAVLLAGLPLLLLRWNFFSPSEKDFALRSLRKVTAFLPSRR